MRSFCLASLVKCSVWTILFLRCVGGHKQAVRISSIAAWSCISIDSAWILCPRPDRVYATDAARPYMHNTFFTFWRVRSWSGCRKLICNSCTCLFVALIGLSVPREITLLWQMLMNNWGVFFSFVVLVRCWWLNVAGWTGADVWLPEPKVRVWSWNLLDCICTCIFSIKQTATRINLGRCDMQVSIG